MDKMQGSMETLSSMQLTADMEGFDAECKSLLHDKAVLAVILQGTVEEYVQYSLEEIMNFIEADSIEEAKEVSTGRTNSQIRGDNVEFTQLNEKTSFFDILFRAKNPKLSGEGIWVNLHIEPQKTYRPGYPIEKRGMYYLARRLSSQLSLVTEETDYGKLEKCYSIWICRDDVPERERYSISFYEIVNTENIGSCVVEKENFDLLKLVVIRLGDKVYNEKEGSKGYRLLRFLNAIMYPHDENFMDTISEYIDFSGNEELWKEKKNMFSMAQCIREDGIQAMVEENLEECIPEGRIIEKLQKYFKLPEEKAKAYYERFAQKL